MRAAVRSVDATLPLYQIGTMDDAWARSTAQNRFNTILLTTLAIIGLVLAAAGTYGVVSYLVSLRAHEIGVRVALGASRGDVLALVTWQGMRPIFTGIAIGAIAAWWGARLLKGSLYGVQ